MEGKKSHSLTKLLRIYLLMVKKRTSFQMAQLSECNGMPPLKSVSPFSKFSWFNFFFFFKSKTFGAGIWLSREEHLLCSHEDLSGTYHPVHDVDACSWNLSIGDGAGER